MKIDRVEELLSEIISWSPEERLRIVRNLEKTLEFNYAPKASSSEIDRDLRRFFTVLANFFVQSGRPSAKRWSLDSFFATKKKSFQKIQQAHSSLEEVLEDITKGEDKKFREEKRAVFYNLIFTGAWNDMEKNPHIPIALSTFLNHLINHGNDILDNSFPGYGSKALLFEMGVWNE